MKYLILIGLLGFGGYKLYQHFTKQSEAVTAYSSFAGKIVRGDFYGAELATTGDRPREELNRRRGQRDLAERTGELGDIQYTKYKVESESYSSDGKSAKLILIQEVHCSRKQIASAMSSSTINFRHSAELIKTEQGWKISSFQFALSDPKPAMGCNYVGMD